MTARISRPSTRYATPTRHTRAQSSRDTPNSLTSHTTRRRRPHGRLSQACTHNRERDVLSWLVDQVTHTVQGNGMTMTTTTTIRHKRARRRRRENIVATAPPDTRRKTARTHRRVSINCSQRARDSERRAFAPPPLGRQVSPGAPSTCSTNFAYSADARHRVASFGVGECDMRSSLHLEAIRSRCFARVMRDICPRRVAQRRVSRLCRAAKILSRDLDRSF